MTTTTIGKWGNASALRLPKLFCESLGIKVGDDVNIYVENDNRIVIEPAHEKFTLKARMQEWDGTRYKCEELDWGRAVGDEIW